MMCQDIPELPRMSSDASSIAILNLVIIKKSLLMLVEVQTIIRKRELLNPF